MRAHYFQHVPYEGLGCITGWLESRAARVTGTRFFESPRLPDPAQVDFLIIMGGPMSVNDEATLPWLRAEKRFIAETIAAGKTVLGICLGAQLIASALGARVYRNPEPEIGWFPIEGLARSFPRAPRCFTGTGRHSTCLPAPGTLPGARPAKTRDLRTANAFWDFNSTWRRQRPRRPR